MQTHQIVAMISLTGHGQEQRALDALLACEHIASTLVVRTPQASATGTVSKTLPADSLWNSSTISAALDWFLGTNATHLLCLLPGTPLIDDSGISRLVNCARSVQSAITYSDYWEIKADNTLSAHPLIDYQSGSIRDDFDFGTVLLLRRDDIAIFRSSTDSHGDTCQFGALYDLRLRLTETGSVFRVAENLYRCPNPDTRASGQKNFDYCDPKARDYQVEMERIATAHLKRINAWLPPRKAPLKASTKSHPVAASVIIPVKNRVKTIGDAVRSALEQKTSFPFNVIVIDNHSNDGTTELLASLAKSHKHLVHLIPNRPDLLIGGCWNEGIHSAYCGEYAVQLDSDDIYSGQDVLERIMAEFHRTSAALVVGSYTIVNVNLEVLPPGLIDHKEWTNHNGHNNALRIAGLGAPRAYHVPTLRDAGGFPNTSYGEDYGAVIRLCRDYPVGRIYESLYWCRRWEGNSDAALPLETSNRYSTFKDRLRTIEIAARRQLNKDKA